MEESHTNEYNPKEIALVLVTYYPKWYRGKVQSKKNTDKIRGDLALEFIKKAASAGYTTIVGEAKSSRTFHRELTAIPNIIIRKRPTLKRSPSKRRLIEYANKLSHIKVIVLTEAEKVSILTDCLAKIVEPLFKNEADIVVPRREEALFTSTYPRYMYESEIEGNLIYNQALRAQGLLGPSLHDLDLFFGPRAFKNEKKIVSLFMHKFTYSTGKYKIPLDLFDVEEYSNALFFPIVEALRKKYKVLDVEVPFSYPLIQKENEEIEAKSHFIEKRKIQRMSILVELMYFLGHKK